MKYIDEYRNTAVAKKLIAVINSLAEKLGKSVSIMEVCGTHTVAMFRYGIRSVLPKNITVVSGPGCPVCVTAQEDIDAAISLSEIKNVIVTTFGDMIKVPGTKTSLGQMRAQGRDIRVVYSVLDALDIAGRNPGKNIVHIAIGFETTAPTIAAALKRARAEKIKNFFIVPSHKIIPPAMKVLAASDKCKINGFLLPGHVSAIIGAQPYEFLVKRYKISSVIAGFEAVDILQATAMLLKQILVNKPAVEIQYARCVHREGNLTAKQMMDEVFKVSDVKWRGLGLMKKSGLALRKEFSVFDALRRFSPKIPATVETPCRCGDVLQGGISPLDCVLFRINCTPQNPIGPCMVSSEGTCAAYYRYGGRNG